MTANSYTYPDDYELRGWTLIDVVAPVGGGMNALLFKEEGESSRLVLSFRGTDLSSAADLCADEILWHLDIGSFVTTPDCSSFSNETLDYYTQALDYTRLVLKNHPESPLLLTGHSLGAGLAVLVSATLDVSPALHVVAFSAPGAAKFLVSRSLRVGSDLASRMFLVSHQWDEVMRLSWEDQVGTLCLYPASLTKACEMCFKERNASWTSIITSMQSSTEVDCKEEQVELRSTSNISVCGDNCWTCFMSNHYLESLIGWINLALKPQCEVHLS